MKLCVRAQIAKMGFSQRQLSEIREIIQETIGHLLSNEKFVTDLTAKITERFDNKCKQYEEQVVGLINKNQYLSEKLESIEQHSRRKNVRIYGIEENERNSGKSLIELLRTKTKLNFTEEAIESVYRIGNTTQNGQRAIFVKFSHVHYKEEIMQKRGALKGTKIIICDDLTKYRHEILKEAVAKLGKRNVFCLGGKVFYKRGSNKYILNRVEDLKRVEIEGQKP